MNTWLTHDDGADRRFRVIGDRRNDGTLRIRLEGELDTFRVGQLRERLAALLAVPPRCVELDLADVGFCDVAGLRELICLRLRGQQEGFEVVLMSASPSVRTVLDLSGDDWISG